jgi:hypothetical protein
MFKPQVMFANGGPGRLHDEEAQENFVVLSWLSPTAEAPSQMFWSAAWLGSL